jgi:putative flippase GtrA
MFSLTDRVKDGALWSLFRQSWRYGVVGVISNAVLYGAYLGMTTLGLGHKTAMTIGFVVGVTQTYFFNKKWSFEHSGKHRATFVKYWVVYILAYFLNLLLLWLLVDVLGFMHQFSQLALIFVCAAFIFALLRLWVFREKSPVAVRS